MDTFFEHMITRKKNIADIAYIAIIVIFGLSLILFLFSFNTTPIASLIFPLQALVVYLAYRAIILKNIEFEYCLTNDALDIDKIINKQKRKRVDTINIKNIISMAPMGSTNLEPVGNRKIVNATSGNKNSKIYCIICNDGKAIYFEPRENMVMAMKTRNPKNIFLD